jgi:lipopolysaccharide transport system permease protein
LFLGLWLGIAVARFRDLQPFIISILGVAIFFSPIFYNLDNLSPGIRNLLLLNPFTYLIMAFRTPLIGEPLLPWYYVGTAIVTVINVALGLAVFTRARSRLPYWVA